MSNKEIDLIDLLVNVFKFFKKKFLFLVIAGVVGIILGVIKNKMGDPYYETSLTIRSSVVNNQTIIELINELGEAYEDGNLEVIAYELGMSDTLMKGIKKFSSYAAGETKEPNCFHLRITYYNPQAIDSFYIGLEEYISKNSYVSKAFEMEKKTTKMLLGKVEEEIGEIDSFQRTYLENISNKSHNNQIVNLGSHDDLVNLLEKKSKFEKDLLYLEEPLIIVRKYFLPIKESSNSWMKDGVIFGFLFAFLALFGLTIRELVFFLNKQ